MKCNFEHIRCSTHASNEVIACFVYCYWNTIDGFPWMCKLRLNCSSNLTWHIFTKWFFIVLLNYSQGDVYEISRSVVPLCDWSVDTGYDTYCKSLQLVWYNKNGNQVSKHYKYDGFVPLEMCEFMKPDSDHWFPPKLWQHTNQTRIFTLSCRAGISHNKKEQKPM